MRLTETDPVYDLVVAGGGVTGAGVFSRAVSLGLKTLLVEQKDFAWGTSSRSSKMVHGGLRYMRQGRFLLTRAAVRERERLLRRYPGLVTPLTFLLPVFRGLGPSRLAMTAGLNIYSFLAGQRQHCVLERDQVLARVPRINRAGLVSAFGFRDAQVDDARLVLRLIFDAVDRGGHALNYTAAHSLCRDRRGQVRGLVLEDPDTGVQREIRARAVVNATGPFAEGLHPSPVKGLHIRPLRGSHLIFPGSLMPLDRVVSFLHPRDRRPVFVFPWQGALVLGTTDVDHDAPLVLEPGISRAEIDYLAEGADHLIPGQGLDPSRAVAALAGIRPVLSRGKKSASGESRDHVIWTDQGLVTVTGGKLTTFDLLARDALKAAAPWLPDPGDLRPPQPKGKGASRGLYRGLGPDVDPDLALVLSGRLGPRLGAFARLVDQVSPQGGFPARGLDLIPGTRTCWAELGHAGAREQVRHLTDLLLRRVRIGLLLPRGGMDLMARIRSHAAPFLPWDDNQWTAEIAAYQNFWEQAHSPGPGAP